MKGKLLIMLLALVIVSCIATYLWYSYYQIHETVELGMDVEVVKGNMLGFNVANDSIHFGDVPPDGSGKRTVLVNNDGNEPFTINIKSYGNISEWITVSDNDFVLGPMETKEIEVNCFVPMDAETGYYTGKLKIIYLRNI
jgi:hypothetical protein